MEDRFKFRAWDGKDMLFPNALVLEGCYIARFTHAEQVTAYEVGPGDHGEVELQDSATIIMQSTGLKDKNGKLIFEGDIIKSSDGLHVVEWHGSGCWNPFVFHEVLGYDDAIVAEYNEIVGNIHENPELLERKE